VDCTSLSRAKALVANVLRNGLFVSGTNKREENAMVCVCDAESFSQLHTPYARLVVPKEIASEGIKTSL
jgi:hypothetical protein